MIYFGEVRNIKDDKTKSGRVQIRSYPHKGMDHSDEKNVKDEDLPWGMPLMPPNSASTGKAGTAPLGLQVGSRVMYTFASDDTEKQYPIIIGGYYRGFPPAKGQNESDPDGMEGLDTSQAGVDLPAGALTSQENLGRNPLHPRITPENTETDIV